MLSDFVASTKFFIFPLELQLLTSQNPTVHFKILPSPNKTLAHSASNLQFNLYSKIQNFIIVTNHLILK